ncbi:hypothetical protein NN561_006579 [Cricetulus griseus]
MNHGFSEEFHAPNYDPAEKTPHPRFVSTPLLRGSVPATAEYERRKARVRRISAAHAGKGSRPRKVGVGPPPQSPRLPSVSGPRLLLAPPTSGSAHSSARLSFGFPGLHPRQAPPTNPLAFGFPRLHPPQAPPPGPSRQKTLAALTPPPRGSIHVSLRPLVRSPSLRLPQAPPTSGSASSVKHDLGNEAAPSQIHTLLEAARRLLGVQCPRGCGRDGPSSHSRLSQRKGRVALSCPPHLHPRCRFCDSRLTELEQPAMPALGLCVLALTCNTDIGCSRRVTGLQGILPSRNAP